MEERIAYIPLGSVVLLNGGVQKLLVVSRAINVEHNGEICFFDYGAVLYPDGLVGDRMAYFNHDGIARVLFEGYEDEDNAIMLENIESYLKEHPDIKRGSPDSWKQS